jgi:hypothetical protein
VDSRRAANRAQVKMLSRQQRKVAHIRLVNLIGCEYAKIVCLSAVSVDARLDRVAGTSEDASATARIPGKKWKCAFDHSAHAKREKDSCRACHSTLFAQDAKAPLSFRPPHKGGEDKKATRAPATGPAASPSRRRVRAPMRNAT